MTVVFHDFHQVLEGPHRLFASGTEENQGEFETGELGTPSGEPLATRHRHKRCSGKSKPKNILKFGFPGSWILKRSGGDVVEVAHPVSNVVDSEYVVRVFEKLAELFVVSQAPWN